MQKTYHSGHEFLKMDDRDSSAAERSGTVPDTESVRDSRPAVIQFSSNDYKKY